MRVSIDSRYIRERPSGIGAYVQALVDRLPGLAPEDRFHLWVDPRARRPLSRCGNVSESVVQAPTNSLRTLLWPARLVDLRGVDLLHTTFNMLGRGVPCASVVTIHDLIWMLVPDQAEGRSLTTPLQTFFYRDGIRRSIRQAARLIAISKATADTIALVAPEVRHRIRVIYHGVEARFRPPDSREQAAEDAGRIIGCDQPYLLVMGHNSPSKNHESVLRAFAAAELGQRCRLVMLQRLYGGRGGLGLFGSRRLDLLAQDLGIGDRVTFLDRLDDDQVVTLVQGALALVHFSRYEGFGMPTLEAMASGTPVVASEIPPLLEVLDGAALHVPLQTAALSRAMGRIVDEPALREQLSGRGVERSATFSWDRCAQQHLEVYREAVADPR